MRYMLRNCIRALVAVFPCLLSGCAAGIVAAIFGISSSGGGSSGSSPVPVVSGVRVTNARSSPAMVSFVITDQESRPADVEVSFIRPARSAAKSEPGNEADGADGAGEEARAGTIARLSGLSSSPDGEEHTVPWDFAREIGPRFQRGVTVRAAIPGGGSAELPDQAVGNDPPVIRDVRVPEGKTAGIAQVRFAIADSSDDLVSVLVEYRPAGSGDDAWEPATPAGSPLVGIQAPSGGKELDFFWNVPVNVGTSDVQVELRLTPNDGVEHGDAVLSSPFRVDNNEKPSVKVFAEPFIRNSDRRGGIPVPFEVKDADGDEVEVVFQWALSGQAFPDLPEDAAEIRAKLGDPAWRREHQVASPRPVPFEGRTARVSSAEDPQGVKVRLPELASSAAGLLPRGIIGRELEILRSSQVPRRSGRFADLRRPVAAVPLSDGIRAVVLDSPADGSWRLREMDLGSGKELRVVASGSDGNPSALGLPTGAGSALVATDSDGAWRIVTIDLETETPEVLFVSDASLPRGPVRSLAALERGAALLTVGDSLVRLQAPPGTPARAGVILRNLHTPWGVVVDPKRPDRAYLAERNGEGKPGSVVALDLRTLSIRPLLTLGRTVERPESLAIERGGDWLLVMTDAGGDGSRELMGIELGAGLGGEAFEIASGFAGAAGALATGPEGLRVLALIDADDLAAGGGVLERRTIREYDRGRFTAEVDRPFDPPPAGYDRWRILDRYRPVRASPLGVRATFNWDTGADLARGGDVLLRATPLDSEVGLADDSAVPRPVEAGFSVTPITLGDASITFTPHALAAVDIDGDGDLDLVSANGDDLALFTQGKPGAFAHAASLPVPVGPRSLVAADLDGDGRTDLAAPSWKQRLAVFFQGAAGFAKEPSLEVDAPGSPVAVVAADLDGDGRTDMVTADADANDLRIFRQDAPRSFVTGPGLTVASPGDRRSPASVAVGDLDGDGDPDLVSANGPGGLLVFSQEGSLKFREAVALPSAGAPRSVTVTDLDGDGALDLAAADQGGDRLAVLLQQGALGTFADAISLEGVPQPRSVAAADLNGDGLPDLTVARRGGTGIFFQSQRGHFDAQTDAIAGGTSLLQSPVAVVAGDLDGDGKADLAAANPVDSNLLLFFRPKTKAYSDPLVLPAPEGSLYPERIAAGDLDGDGDLDLAVRTNGAGATDDNLVFVFFQKSPGIFAEAGRALRFPPDAGPWQPVLADLNGDGSLDIAVPIFGFSDSVATNPGRILLYFQRAPGEFPDAADQVLPTPGEVINDLLAADLDENGRLDLATGGTKGFSIFLQQGPGQFHLLEPRPTFVPQGSNGTWFLAAADLNGDGLRDLATANGKASQSINVFFQKAPGVFVTAPDRVFGNPQGEDSVVLAAGDVDGDGKVDLVSGGWDEHRNSLYFQRGAGEFPFTPDVGLMDPSTVGGGAGPVATSLADLDGDGYLDVISGDGFGGSLWIYLQKRPRAFGDNPDLVLPGPHKPYHVLALDIDGDGEPDLVSGNNYNDTISIFFGRH